MKTEKAIAAIFLVGLVFKLMHWPGAGPLLVVSLSTLILLFFFGSFYFFSDRELKRQKLGLSIAAGIILSWSCIGIMFRLMYWPGGKNMLGIPMIGLPVVLAVALYLREKSPGDLQVYYRNMLLRVLLVGLLAVPLYFASNKDLLQIQYPNDPEAVRIKANYFDHPENEAYAKEYHDYMEAQRAGSNR